VLGGVFTAAIECTYEVLELSEVQGFVHWDLCRRILGPKDKISVS
jgi:hypothetical protein